MKVFTPIPVAKCQDGRSCFSDTLITMFTCLSPINGSECEYCN